MPVAPTEPPLRSPIYGRLYGVVGCLYDKSPYAKLISRFGESAGVAEKYQLASLAAGIAAIVAGLSHYWILVAVIGMIAGLRAFDIILYAVWWSFVRAPLRVISRKRSLAMFLVNLAEVVIWYAVIGMAVGCADRATFTERVAALYGSLRTAVTIGSAAAPVTRYGCMTLEMSQIVESYFLTALIIASLLSAIQRDQAGPDDEKDVSAGAG